MKRFLLPFAAFVLIFCIAAIPGSIYSILYGCCAVAIILDGFTVSKKQGA